MRPTFILLLALPLTGCMLDAQEESKTDDFRFPVEGVARVEVRSDDGPIEVRGTSASEVVVKVYRRARGPSRRAAAELLEGWVAEAHQVGRTVRVEARRREGRHRNWGRAWAEIEIRVPRRADLQLETRDGRIEMDDVEGTIELASGDGALHLRDVKGELKLRASDGSIQGYGLSGDLDASTGDGRIRLEGSFSGLRAVTSDGSIQVHCENALPLSRDWLLRSSDGSIELTLPRDVSAELAASTGDGRIRSDLSLRDEKKSRDHLRGKLGDGGRLILIKTSDGGIRLRSR